MGYLTNAALLYDQAAQLERAAGARERAADDPSEQPHERDVHRRRAKELRRHVKTFKDTAAWSLTQARVSYAQDGFSLDRTAMTDAWEALHEERHAGRTGEGMTA
ncbi:hypothetical protein [Patulibacter sp. SYSU D01012]|uniref:hypothetical protein n=1 Tax=Patulibacter sp. SYSU D01012 TaxID=2817381 RepID=UPI001B317454|nr:hypothetical protein [Patulibacter sp. SYSU D01012]